MKKVFLSTLIPPELENEVRQKSIDTMQDAANSFQWSLYKGLCENYNDTIKIINYLPIGSYPQYYHDSYVKQKEFETEFCKNNISIGFINVKLIRRFFIYRNLYKELKKTFSKEEGLIFLYTIEKEMVESVCKLKKRNDKIKICAIVADLPNMINLSNKNGWLHKLYNKYLSNKSYSYLGQIDYYVLLTKQMKEYMKINSPFCVVEGIATTDSNLSEESNENKVVMYSGTLHEKFGIINLLEAFSRIKDKNYKLWICGNGDSKAAIIKAAERDERIIFFGQIPRDEVLKLQRKSTVLINPRQNTEEFTKYSFPSKNLEYLSAGKPVIAYKLDGIPEDYDNVLLYVSDNTIDALKEKIEYVCTIDEKERKQIGEQGKEFVLKQKNYYTQTRKIVEMIEE